MKLFRYFNIVLFAILIGLFLFYAPGQKLSTNLLSLLPQNKETKLLKLYEKFQSSREILLALKGDDLRAIKALEQRVLQNDFITLKNSFFANQEFRKYIKEYSFYLQNFDTQNIYKIQQKLQSEYTNLLTNPYYATIDPKDPLGLFTQKKSHLSFYYKKGHLYLNNYGYVSIFTFKEGTGYKKIYDVFEKEMQNDIKIFSPTFYFVENSRAIRAQVNILVFIAISILLLLYVVILKNISLLANTILTLVNASLLSLLIVTSLWGEVSLFVIVFGMAVSTIAIDYMFHHYFCGYYEEKKGFNKAVFFGFLSTFLAFFVISFVSFPFIKQVSVYTLISLSFSYVVFAFVFPQIGFTCKDIKISLPSVKLIKNYKYFVLILLVLIGYFLLHVKIDLDIKNLDYQNVKLKKLESFFKSKLQSSDKTAFIIKARSIDALIEKNEELHSLHVDAIIPLSNLISSESFKKRKDAFSKIDFLHVKEELLQKAESIGFRKDFFHEAYSAELLNPKEPKYTLENINKYGFDVLYDGTFYYSYGFMKSSDNVKGVYFIDSANLFKKSLRNIYNQLYICGLLIFVSIVFILYFVTKENFFKALSYVLAPIAFCLFVMIFANVNILQIFMLFVIISLSTDYGIYMSEKSVDTKINKAIIFSLLSTYAGFGVLFFSSIGVLFYIGEVATFGLLAILILLVIGKN